MRSIATDEPWDEGTVDHIRHRLDRLHSSVPQHDFQEDAFTSLGLEIHVEDEIAERVHYDSRPSHLQSLHPVRMATDHQIGASISEGTGSEPLAGLDTMRVLGAPVCEHYGDIDPLAEGSDVGADPLELRAIQAGRYAVAC